MRWMVGFVLSLSVACTAATDPHTPESERIKSGRGERLDSSALVVSASERFDAKETTWGFSALLQYLGLAYVGAATQQSLAASITVTHEGCDLPIEIHFSSSDASLRKALENALDNSSIAQGWSRAEEGGVALAIQRGASARLVFPRVDASRSVELDLVVFGSPSLLGATGGVGAGDSSNSGEPCPGCLEVCPRCPNR